MVGSPWKICAKPRAVAVFSSDEPGSVTATKRSAAFAPARTKKYSISALGSVVPPDLLETMNSVLSRLIDASVRCTCAGSVESTMRRFGKPSACPKVSASTSGPRLDPPMPRTTTSVKFLLFTQPAKAT